MPAPQLPYTSRPTVPPLAVVLGLNEVATAVAIALHHYGYSIIMSHDPDPPVMRRGMSYFDALFHDLVTVEGVEAVCVEDTLAVRAQAARHDKIAVTRLGLMELLTIGGIELLVDARMQKHNKTPDLRHVASITVGLGPGFTVGQNCDAAIETKPGLEGTALTAGSTLAPDGISRQIGGKGAERFVYSKTSGLWRSALDVGARVYKGFPVGVLEEQTVEAPFDGILRGIVRDGMHVSKGVKLIEVDPRGRKAQWTGIDEKGYAIAQATCSAVKELQHIRRRGHTNAG